VDRALWFNYDFLYQKYFVEEMSTVKLAAFVDTFPNTIRRALKHFGIPSRNRSAAAKNFLENNEHPRSGVKRSQSEREKISQGVQKAWNTLPAQQNKARRKRLSESARAQWDNLDEDERAATLKKMARANKETRTGGSKNENMVAALLGDLGYKVTQRTKDFTPDGLMEIDIALYNERVAIEWDGPSHFLPIYGDENFERVKEKDERKNTSLMSNGWTVLRCRDYSSCHSLAFCKRAVKAIVDFVTQKAPKGVYYIDAR